MALFKKIVARIAEEVHKSKIEELEKRILLMEQDHKLNSKTISDNEQEIKDLKEKLYYATIMAEKMEATITTVLTLKGHEVKKLKDSNDEPTTL